MRHQKVFKGSWSFPRHFQRESAVDVKSRKAGGGGWDSDFPNDFRRRAMSSMTFTKTECLGVEKRSLLDLHVVLWRSLRSRRL